ncbi:1046_t:CDS:10 [Diversispora eburnea]|uniref:1046_t:CDS:1 n=1 Tax=Diversispora eburnea TaxID=1213867 RepID=A0A9N9FHQ6_9GLOM|nr:1046_t:CDS:10 [Diversispora eburnea]
MKLIKILSKINQLSKRSFPSPYPIYSLYSLRNNNIVRQQRQKIYSSILLKVNKVKNRKSKFISTKIISNIRQNEQNQDNLTIKRVTNQVVDQDPELPPVELRIVDIAIDRMMGFEFCNKINEYLTLQGVDSSNIHKIESNPDKSKHLETATTKLFGNEIDFVNLRNEEYNDFNRIPDKITFGTPEQDAYRRDATVNALFYNINTDEIEDFTKKGIPDLIKGIIRTPLPAYETFRDDPLRIIRLIRFASRFHFEIIDDIVNSVKDEKIKEALKLKISRERFGQELNKMFKGPDPVSSIELICKLGLYEIIFCPIPDYTQIRNLGNFDDLSNADNEMVEKLINNIDIIMDKVKKNEEIILDRKPMGLLIRELKDKWLNSIIITLAYELMPEFDNIQKELWDKPNEIIRKYNNFISRIYDLGLQECEVIKLLNIKPGIIMKQILNSVIEWQLENPNGSKEQCEKYIKDLPLPSTDKSIN